MAALLAAMAGAMFEEARLTGFNNRLETRFQDAKSTGGSRKEATQ